MQLVCGFCDFAALVAGALQLVRRRLTRAVAAGDRCGAVGRASPKVVKITPVVSARATQSSTRPIGRTHTGQPGPCTSSTTPGNICSMPYPKIAWVWPPHTSRICNGLCRQTSICATSPLFSSSGWRLRPLEYAHRWSPCGIVQKDRPVARQRQNGLPLARALQPLAQLGQKSPKAGIVRGPHYIFKVPIWRNCVNPRLLTSP